MTISVMICPDCKFAGGLWFPLHRSFEEIFHDCPGLRDGHLWVSEKPGRGIAIDEAAAAKAPFTDHNGLNGGWGEIRNADGTVIEL